MDSDQATLWPNEYGRKYGLPSASEQGNANANSFLDPNGMVSGFYNDVMGYTSQSREFAQQEYLMDKENAYNDPRAQMARMIAAGISPAAAAAAITGGQNVSAQAPSVASATPSAAAADAASALLGGFSGAAVNYASAATDNLSRTPRIKEILSNTHKNLTSAGVDDNTARNLAIQNTFLPLEKQLGLQNLQMSIGLQHEQIAWYGQSIDNMKAQIREINQNIATAKAHANLEEQLALESQKRQLQLDLQNFQLNFDNNLRRILHVDPNNDLQNNIYLRNLQGYDTSKDVQVLEDINYKVASGQFNAEDNFAYSIAYRRKNGENAADVVNGSVGGPVGFLNRMLNVGVATLNGAMAQFNKSADAAHKWIVGKINDGKYNSVRNALQDQLEEYRKMENPPAEIQQAMLDLEQILQLSNSELYDYFVKRK